MFGDPYCGDDVSVTAHARMTQATLGVAGGVKRLAKIDGRH